MVGGDTASKSVVGFDHDAMAVLSLIMSRLLENAFDLASDADLLRRRPYGVIEVRGGRLAAIHLRPWPKLVSLLDVSFGNWYHDLIPGDRLRLYYNQPR